MSTTQEHTRTGTGAPQGAPDQQVPGHEAWRLVAAREMSVKLHDRTFLLSTAFMLVLVVASIAFSAFMGGRGQTATVAVLDGTAEQLVTSADEAGEAADSSLSLEARTASGTDETRRWLTDGEVDAALLPLEAATGSDARWELVGLEDVDGELRALVSQAVADRELSRNAQEVGTTVEDVLAGTVLAERVLQTGGLAEELQFGLAFVFAFLFYVTALVFGLSIAQSVIEEKQSRVVEILAAAVPVRQLLAGKVIGNTLLAIGQVVLLAAVGLVGLSLSGQGEVLALVLGASVWFVVFFLLGFAALACVWAVCGSIATRQEDLQATTMPVQSLVFIALFVGIAGSGKFLTVASFVPLVSSVAMPVRLLAGDVPIWQPLVAAGLVVVTAVVLIVLGARLYEGSLLRTDRRTKLREALQGH